MVTESQLGRFLQGLHVVNDALVCVKWALERRVDTAPPTDQGEEDDSDHVTNESGNSAELKITFSDFFIAQ